VGRHPAQGQRWSLGAGMEVLPE